MTSIKKLACFPLLLAIALILGGCSKSSSQTGSITTGATGQTTEVTEAQRRQVARLGERHRQNPGDPEIALALANSLESIGQSAQALSVLGATAGRVPDNARVASAYGRALVRQGDYAEALEALERAGSRRR
jgi:Flp pilus assembly protein TadD